jgi:hypothetical protein
VVPAAAWAGACNAELNYIYVDAAHTVVGGPCSGIILFVRNRQS